MAVYFKNAKCLILKSGGIYSYHCAVSRVTRRNAVSDVQTR